MSVRKLTYPIILHPETSGGYTIEIPDINNGAWTQGESIAEAIEMAEDLIGTMLQHTTTYPAASSIDALVKNPSDIVALATVDIDEFRKAHSTTIRKNVSIPEYLVVLGKEQGVNFSEVLTTALRKQLGA